MSHPTTQKLKAIIAIKQTNLALSLDLANKAEFLKIADLLGPEICILKTHIDIIEDYDQTFLEALKKLANQHQFLIFEDRKFADIGETVKHQFSKGIFHIRDWADIVNAHGEFIETEFSNLLHDISARI